MIWFKHYTNASRGNSLTQLRDEMGNEGYAFYFLLLELCGEQWDIKEPPIFTFNTKQIATHFRCKPARVLLILRRLSTLAGIEVVDLENQITIKIPNMLKYLDKYAKYNSKRVVSLENAGGREEKRKEKEYILNSSSYTHRSVRPTEHILERDQETVRRKQLDDYKKYCEENNIPF